MFARGDGWTLVPGLGFKDEALCYLDISHIVLESEQWQGASFLRFWL